MISGISGLNIDINLIVSQLIGRYSTPLTSYQTKQTYHQTQLNSLNSIKSSLTTMKDSLYHNILLLMMVELECMYVKMVSY